MGEGGSYGAAHSGMGTSPAGMLGVHGSTMPGAAGTSVGSVGIPGSANAAGVGAGHAGAAGGVSGLAGGLPSSEPLPQSLIYKLSCEYFSRPMLEPMVGDFA